MMQYELMAIDGRKSFYNKAVVKVNGDIETLYSYNTPIISKNTTTGELKKLWGGWSATTGRHIKAFCGLNKAEFMKLPHTPTPREKAEAYNSTLYR